jgi:hypothetical protein
VDFTPPTTGPTPTSYTVTATDVVTTSTVTASGASSPISVSGLTTGDTYTFTVTAVVGSGDCAATPPTAQCATSPASADVVIPAVAQPAAPDEPTINTVVPGAAGSGTATVSFAAAPTGTAATSFTVTALDQLDPSDTVAETVTSSPAVVTGLTPGQTYTFSLVANNAVGSSSTAFWAPPVTPQVVDGPELPTITGSPVRATAGHRYAYQIVLGGMPAPDAYVGGTLPTGLHMTLKGLLEGTPTKAGLFSFTVTATSTAGSASRTVTLRVEPGPFHELRLVGFSHLQALRSGYAVGLRLALADRYGNTVSLRRTLTLRIAVGPADFAGGLRTVTVRTGRGGTATTPRLFVTGRSNVDIDVSVPGLRPEVIVLRVIR